MGIRSGGVRRRWDPRARLSVALLGLALVTLAAGACATAGAGAKAIAIESVASLAGTWTGTVNFGGGRGRCTVIIEPSGRAVVSTNLINWSGTVTVESGKATYSFPSGSSGMLTLHEDGDKRELNLKGHGGRWEAWVTRN